MPLSARFEFLPLTAIWVPRAPDGATTRQRSTISTKDLMESIRARGVMNPIIVSAEAGPSGEPYKIIAGERRYAASLELGLPAIPARHAEDLSAVEAQIIELEENVKRSDLPWQDIVRASARIHDLYKALDEGQTLEETSEAIGLSKSTLSLYLRVHGALEDERIAGCSTVREAYNILARRDARASGEALEELIGGPVLAPQVPVPGAPASPETSNVTVLSPASGGASGGTPATPVLLAPSPRESILHESFIQWAPRYTGQRFNFIHCDFPYGVNLFNGPQGGGQAADGQAYDDAKEVFFRLLDTLVKNLPRLASTSTHFMFWYSEKHGTALRAALAERAPMISWWPFPLIWHKTDNAGIAQDVRRGPRHVYETCLFGAIGQRQIVKLVSDVYGAPTDKRWHPSTKPEPMLRHFMSMMVDEHTRLLDPTCGSGSALRAAESLGAASVLGMDSDEQTVGLARTALRQARTLRGLGIAEG